MNIYYLIGVFVLYPFFCMCLGFYLGISYGKQKRNEELLKEGLVNDVCPCCGSDLIDGVCASKFIHGAK